MCLTRCCKQTWRRGWEGKGVGEGAGGGGGRGEGEGGGGGEGVFRTFDPPPPLRSASVSSPPHQRWGVTHSPGGEGGRGSIFWKTPDIALASYNLIPLRSRGSEINRAMTINDKKTREHLSME